MSERGRPCVDGTVWERFRYNKRGTVLRTPHDHLQHTILDRAQETVAGMTGDPGEIF